MQFTATAPQNTSNSATGFRYSSSQRSAADGAPSVRVAVVYRALPYWRTPLFERLSDSGQLELRVFYGRNVSSAKHTSVDVERSWASGLRAIPLRLSVAGESLSLPLFPGLLFELYRYKPDVIVTEGASNFMNNLVVYLYRRLFGVKVIWWSLGRLSESRAAGLLLIPRRLLYFGERGADAVLAYSTQGAKYFKSIGYDEHQVTAAINCVGDLPSGLAGGQAQETRSADERREVEVLFVGALTAVKRADVLCSAVQQLRSEGLPVRLVVVGDGPLRAELEANFRGSGVEFLGKVVDDVDRFFARADIFVLPGLGGLALSQAALHSLPLVSGPADGTERDYVIDGENGVLLETVTVTALTDALRPLVLDEPLRARMGARSAAILAEREIGMDSYARRFVAAVESVTPREAAGLRASAGVRRYPSGLKGRLHSMSSTFRAKTILGVLSCGTGVIIGRGCDFKRSVVSVGNWTFIGPGCSIRVPTSIGNFVMLARNVTIAGDDHSMGDIGMPMILGDRPEQRRVTIGNDVWVGAGVTILAGANIGDGSVIGANAVVVGDVPPNSIVGAPLGQVLRSRFEDDEFREHLQMLEDRRRDLARL